MITWILFALIVILQGLDIYTTMQALKKPGVVEGNKVVAWIMGKVGVLLALFIIKLVFCALLATVIFFVVSMWLTVVLAIIVTGYSYVVWSNVRKG